MGGEPCTLCPASSTGSFNIPPAFEKASAGKAAPFKGGIWKPSPFPLQPFQPLQLFLSAGAFFDLRSFIEAGSEGGLQLSPLSFCLSPFNFLYLSKCFVSC